MATGNSSLNDKPSLRDLLEVQNHFGLPSPALVEKDWYVVKALAAINSADTAPFRLVFGGGTALSRAHRLVRRMSEDIDLKITSDAQFTRPALREPARYNHEGAAGCGVWIRSRKPCSSRFGERQPPHVVSALLCSCSRGQRQSSTRNSNRDGGVATAASGSAAAGEIVRGGSA
jgi:hypothetical protein